MRLVSHMPVADIKGELGTRLKKMRLEKRMTQKELCEAAGIPISTLVRIERGEIKSFDSFLMLLKSFGQIEKLELVLPETQIRPTELVQRKKTSQRVRKSKKDTTESGWKWGDEE